jgi:hypothetical protein
MADEFLTVSKLDRGDSPEIHYRQAMIPTYRTASYEADDTDNHKMLIDARGKGRMSLAVDNPSDQSVVVALYGAHTEDSDVGDADVILIDAAFLTITTGVNGYEITNDPFPFYIVSLSSTVAPDGSVVSCWVNLSAF